MSKNKIKPQSTMSSPPEVFFKQTLVSTKSKKSIDAFTYGGNHADVRVKIIHDLDRTFDEKTARDSSKCKPSDI